MWGAINGIIHLAESRQVREDELDGLIAVSDEAIEVLEQKVAAPLEQRRPPEPA